MTVSREVAAVEFGPVRAHAVSLEEAIDIIVARARGGEGGFVLTPNVDHISISRRNGEFAAAYGRCFLSLADGMPLVAMSRLLRLPLRHKVSGSDLFEPLIARCEKERAPRLLPGSLFGGMRGRHAKTPRGLSRDSRDRFRLLDVRSRSEPRGGGSGAAPSARQRGKGHLRVPAAAQADHALPLRRRVPTGRRHRRRIVALLLCGGGDPGPSLDVSMGTRVALSALAGARSTVATLPLAVRLGRAGLRGDGRRQARRAGMPSSLTGCPEERRLSPLRPGEGSREGMCVRKGVL